jgi:hypothetical protein
MKAKVFYETWPNCGLLVKCSLFKPLMWLTKKEISQTHSYKHKIYAVRKECTRTPIPSIPCLFLAPKYLEIIIHNSNIQQVRPVS